MNHPGHLFCLLHESAQPYVYPGPNAYPVTVPKCWEMRKNVPEVAYPGKRKRSGESELKLRCCVARWGQGFEVNAVWSPRDPSALLVV